MSELTRFDLKKDSLVLSGLESSLMHRLWECRDCTARQLYKGLKRKDIAQITVVVTLDRLYKKGLVERSIEKGRGGLHYVYAPKMSKSDLGRHLSLMFAEKIINTFGPGVASFFSMEALAELRKNRKFNGRR